MHAFEAHTSDIEVRIEARSARELFIEAGLALAEVMLGRAGPPGAAQPPAAMPLPAATLEYEVVSLSAPDRDALLVDWLNELIYRAEITRKVFTRFTIELLTDHALVAGIQGAPAEDLRSLVKAATFHGLRTTDTEEGVAATVILDV